MWSFRTWGAIRSGRAGHDRRDRSGPSPEPWARRGPFPAESEAPGRWKYRRKTGVRLPIAGAAAWAVAGAENARADGAAAAFVCYARGEISLWEEVKRHRQ